MQIDFDQFDDELQTMQQLMEEEEIALRDEDLEKPIRLLGLRSPVVVNAGTTLHGAIQTMLARRFGCVLVVKSGKVAGIFTERDVLMKVAGQDVDLKAAKIDDFMTPNPASKSMDDTLLSALQLMHEGGYRHLAIVDEAQHPQAVLSVKDIINYIVQFFPQDVLNLPPHPIRIGTKNREGG